MHIFEVIAALKHAAETRTHRAFSARALASYVVASNLVLIRINTLTSHIMSFMIKTPGSPCHALAIMRTP